MARLFLVVSKKRVYLESELGLSFVCAADLLPRHILKQKPTATNDHMPEYDKTGEQKTKTKTKSKVLDSHI